MRLRVFFTIGWILLTGGQGSAHVSWQTARQGDPAQYPADPNAYRSPMVLDTIFAAGDRSLWKDGKWFTLHEWWELGRFTCDGVGLRGGNDRKKKWDEGLEMRVHDLPGGNLEVRMRVGVRNPRNNHDKIVSVFLEVLNGEDLVASDSLRIQAEDDGDVHDAKLKWTIPTSSLRPTTKLRITMKTENY